MGAFQTKASLLFLLQRTYVIDELFEEFIEQFTAADKATSYWKSTWKKQQIFLQ